MINIEHLLQQMKQFISKIVNSILANIELAATACDPFTGTFLESMDFALPLIGEINVAQGSDNMLSNYNAANPSVEEVLCIAMSVAQVALGEDPNIIRGSCCSVSIRTYGNSCLHVRLLEACFDLNCAYLLVFRTENDRL